MILLNFIMHSVRDLPILSAGGAADAGGQQLGWASDNKRWMEISFHPNHWLLHTHTRTQHTHIEQLLLLTSERNRRCGKVISKVRCCFFSFLFSWKVFLNTRWWISSELEMFSVTLQITLLCFPLSLVVFLRCRSALGFFAYRSFFAQLSLRPSAWWLR